MNVNDLGQALTAWNVSLPCIFKNTAAGGLNSSTLNSRSGGGGEGLSKDGEECSNELVYMTAVGTMNNCLGGASLYVSMDELRYARVHVCLLVCMYACVCVCVRACLCV